jgi:hypothetical protein
VLLGDCAPDAGPDQEPGSVTVSEHQIGIFGCLELGMFAEFVHHLVSGAQDFEIGQHNFLHSLYDRIAGVRDGIVGFAFQPEQRPSVSTGAFATCAIPTRAALCETRLAAVLPPLTEFGHETIPSETARP